MSRLNKLMFSVLFVVILVTFFLHESSFFPNPPSARRNASDQKQEKQVDEQDETEESGQGSVEKQTSTKKNTSNLKENGTNQGEQDPEQTQEEDSEEESANDTEQKKSNPDKPKQTQRDQAGKKKINKLFQNARTKFSKLPEPEKVGSLSGKEIRKATNRATRASEEVLQAIKLANDVRKTDQLQQLRALRDRIESVKVELQRVLFKKVSNSSPSNPE